MRKSMCTGISLFLRGAWVHFNRMAHCVMLFLLMNAVPIIEISDLTVSESVGLVQIPVRRVGGDLSLPSLIVVSYREVGSATGLMYK